MLFRVRLVLFAGIMVFCMLLRLTKFSLQLSSSLLNRCMLIALYPLLLQLFLAAGQGLTRVDVVYANVSSAVFLTVLIDFHVLLGVICDSLCL